MPKCVLHTSCSGSTTRISRLWEWSTRPGDSGILVGGSCCAMRAQWLLFPALQRCFCSLKSLLSLRDVGEPASSLEPLLGLGPVRRAHVCICLRTVVYRHHMVPVSRECLLGCRSRLAFGCKASSLATSLPSWKGIATQNRKGPGQAACRNVGQLPNRLSKA